MMMLWWHAVLLGVVEGLTEFLPVSSTGHLLLSARAMGLDGAFVETFTIAIQSGAMLAVILATWRDWLKKRTWVLVIAGFLPTAAIGLVLYPFVRARLFEPIIVAYALIIGGILMYLVEKLLARRTVEGTQDITVQQASMIGVAQALAVIPGVSRSAATILGGRMLGIGKEAIVRFSFLLAVPTIGAATVLDLWKERAMLAESDWGMLLLGAVVSAVVAGGVIQLFLAFIRRYSFISFAVYRVLFGALVWWILWR